MNTLNNDFKVNKFNKKSFTMLILLIITFILSYFGLGAFFFIIGLFFISFPELYNYRPFSSISLWMLRISRGKLRLIKYIPILSLGGEWILQDTLEEINLLGISDLLKFIKKHSLEFFITFPGLLATNLRIFLHIESQILNLPSNQEYFVGLSLYGSFFAIFCLPIVFGLYFCWVWVWKDSGIKIMKVNLEYNSTKIIEEVWDASDSIRNFVGIFAGFSALTWLAEHMASTMEFTIYTGLDYYSYLLGIILGVLLFFTGPSILMGIMYYRSGYHEKIVNDLRRKISTNYENLKIGNCIFDSR